MYPFTLTAEPAQGWLLEVGQLGKPGEGAQTVQTLRRLGRIRGSGLTCVLSCSLRPLGWIFASPSRPRKPRAWTDGFVVLTVGSGDATRNRGRKRTWGNQVTYKGELNDGEKRGSSPTLFESRERGGGTRDQRRWG